MQREECNDMISNQDTRAKGGVTGQRGSRDHSSCLFLS